MKKGFTLIELLVVVLIIGILAAVALPQYHKAVGKARVAELKTILPTLLSAIRVAHLETGEIPPSLDDLAVELPQENWDINYDECLSENGRWGCAINFFGKGKMTDYNLRYCDKEYMSISLGVESPFAWFCTHHEDPTLCKNLGFTKYSEAFDMYTEP